jgi:uncharacterized protein YceK
MNKIILIIGLLSLSGCASLQDKLNAIAARSTPGSYVAPEITQSDADEVAMDMAQFLSVQLPPAKTTLDLQLSSNKLHMKLIDQLMVRGFGIVQSKSLPEHQEGAVPLRYTVTPFDKGVLVELRYAGLVASRYLPRGNDGHLSLHNKYAVRGAK